MITIKKNLSPNLKIPKFKVDGLLHPKLNDYELTSLLNKHNFTLFLGKSGSGKTSLEISFLTSIFKNVYHNIFLFAPSHSRASVSNNFWEKNLPEEQIFDDLTLENLQNTYDYSQENAENGYKTLIIIDDNQKYLKDLDIQKLLLHMVNNRRHACLSIHLLCQNYFQIPKQVRMALTNLFVFKVSKPEITNIYNEQIESSKELFDKIMSISFNKKHEFLFIDCLTKRIFLNFDEIIYQLE
jgi:energy-coupling factor transporter ATP-binding protein EcfA2